MNLLERTTVHADSFPLESFSLLYARSGAGPNAAGNFRVPQRTSCCFRRLLTGTYVLNRLRPSPQMIWPVKAPERIAVVELRGERICFRMRNLAFFEQGLQFSTIVNAQIPWLSFESPLVTCLTGNGRVGIRIDGAPDCVAASPSARARHVIDRALAVPGDVALFSHGHMLRVLAATWLRLAPEDGERFYLETGTVSILGFERETRVIRMWNGRA